MFNLSPRSFLANICDKTSVGKMNELLNDQDLLKVAFATSMRFTCRLVAGGHRPLSFSEKNQNRTIVCFIL